MLNKRQRLGRRERVKIFIGGVPAATTDRGLELFLRQGGGQPGLKYAFESRSRWRFAVIEGTGAHRAVLAMVKAAAGGSDRGVAAGAACGGRPAGCADDMVAR